MQPEDRLDALLSSRRVETGATAQQWPADDPLAPLLGAADRLTTLATAEPEPAFASALEAQLIRYAAQHAQPAPATTTQNGGIPLAAPTAVLAPRTSSGEPGSRARVRGRIWAGRTSGHRPWLLWPALAAALLLMIGGGALTAAAHAQPGSPLFGMREWEQGVRVTLASSAGDRVRLHLAYANDALAALDAALARHAGDPTYSDSLESLRSEDQAVASGIADLPTGNERDDLAAQLADLRSRERNDLRGALPAIGWPDRVATTSALGQAGDSVPTVTSVAIQRVQTSTGTAAGESEQRRWQIVVHGTGFERGAVLLINGVPTGTVLTVSPTMVQAQIDGSRLYGQGERMRIGIGNPDSTAADTVHVSQGSGQDDSRGAQATPTGGSGHGGDDGRGGDNGPGHSGTPTPTTTRTPSPDH